MSDGKERQVVVWCLPPMPKQVFGASGVRTTVTAEGVLHVEWGNKTAGCVAVFAAGQWQCVYESWCPALPPPGTAPAASKWAPDQPGAEPPVTS